MSVNTVVNGELVQVAGNAYGVVDDELSATSTNPVQNKVVAEKFAEAEEVRQLKTYTNLASLGLSLTTNTMEEVYTGIPLNSMVIINISTVSGVHSSWNMPSTNAGTLVIYRLTTIRGWIEYHVKNKSEDYRMEITDDEVPVPTGNWVKLMNQNDVSNDNIVVNPNFKLNSNGQTIYNTDGFTVNNWRSYNKPTITVLDDGIKIERTSSSVSIYSDLYQEFGNWGSYIGKYLTISLKVDEVNTIYPSTARLIVWDGKREAVGLTLSEPGIYSKTNKLPSDASMLIIYLRIQNGTGSVKINWVKLEEGEIATPFTVPNPSLEWDKSLRYGTKFKLTEGALYSNPTLLINGDFSINQRGKTEYTGTNIYTFDRWRTWSNGGGFKVYKNDSENLVLEALPNVVNAYRSIWQHLENAKELLGKTLTLSIKYKTASEKAALIDNLSTQNNAPNSYMYLPKSINWNIVQKTFTVVNANNTGIAFGLSNEEIVGFTIEVEWVKLELGSIATPFVPPDPGEELAKCQRYYQRIDGIITNCGLGIAVSETTVDIMIPLPTSLRIQSPTVNFKNLGLLGDNASSIALSHNVTSFLNNEVRDNCFITQMVSSEIVRGNCYSLAIKSVGYIEFDAEIY